MKKLESCSFCNHSNDILGFLVCSFYREKNWDGICPCQDCIVKSICNEACADYLIKYQLVHNIPVIMTDNEELIEAVNDRIKNKKRTSL